MISFVWNPYLVLLKHMALFLSKFQSVFWLEKKGGGGVGVIALPYSQKVKHFLMNSTGFAQHHQKKYIWYSMQKHDILKHYVNIDRSRMTFGSNFKSISD